MSDAVSENVFGTVSDSEVVLLMRRFRRPQQEKFICRKVIANSGMYVMRFSKTKFTMCRGNGYGTQLGKGESAPPFLIDLRSIRTKKENPENQFKTKLNLRKSKFDLRLITQQSGSLGSVEFGALITYAGKQLRNLNN